MKYKSRKIKSVQYEAKYQGIPTDYYQRLNYMCNQYEISESKYNKILAKKQCMLENLYYYDLNIILYEEPEGSPRPRTRIINRKNFMNEAMSNSSFVHVYSVTGKEDSVFMQRLMEQDLLNLQCLIDTPCNVEFNCFFKTPNTFNVTDKFLAEIGLIRYIPKPDWDNIGKKYSDMYNHNIWIDDSYVIDGTVRKFYSILPRVEIRLRYLNTLYNKYQYNSLIKRKDYNPESQTMYLDKDGNLAEKRKE
jgi:Holliday junction resolvase RusA-like endonuclease